MAVRETPFQILTLPTLFNQAAQKGYLEFLNLLVKRWFKENFDQRLINHTFLDTVETENWKIVEILLKNGADVNFQNTFALRRALFYKRIETVRFLIGNGANITDDILENAKNK